MGEQFVSEVIEPDAGTGNVIAMARGEPGLPKGFTWRAQHVQVARLLETWKTNAGAGEGKAYLRRHWFKVVADDGRTMTLYCLRHARPGQPHWWLYSIHEEG